MASRLNPYISFSDSARQALEFYQGVFGGRMTHLIAAGEFAYSCRMRLRLEPDDVPMVGRRR